MSILKNYGTNKNVGECQMNVLVTGGLGYIGSHTVVELSNLGHSVIIVDNLMNAEIEVLEKINILCKKEIPFYKIDLCDLNSLKKLFNQHVFDAVIHFAGLKAVGESNEKPLQYYSNNLISTLNLLNVMSENNCKSIVFSSSATIYGQQSSPMLETYTRITTNPYGATKRQIEEICEDVAKADSTWSMTMLRYFNPIGAHPSGLLGDNPQGLPNNLMPYVTKVANKEIDILQIFGNDYNTIDGTGVRDYIHVLDLSLGHIYALDFNRKHKGYETFNLGTGHGTSVLELVHTFERVTGNHVPYQFTSRRSGDVDVCYACVDKAKEKLNWSAQYSLESMCLDHWNFTLKTSKSSE